MAKRKVYFTRSLALITLIGVIFLFGSSVHDFSMAKGEKLDRKVGIALGFHINLYHSYRLDTNDEYGFGKDIRIIRNTIRTLDEFNRRGVRVKAVWDVDNLFSLQEILPKYAPDIIRDIRRRVRDNGDEIIIMSYNNGLASAMTEDEFKASIRLAMTNPGKSGLLDVFGRVSPIVRPQEMMVTPGNFNLYRQMGVEAIVMYYSAIPFDAFRVFVEPLSFQEALNPILYANDQTGESMTVIPAYTIGDLLENTSLGSWVRRLQGLQRQGEIQSDLLIFVNFDADDAYWTGYDVPWHLSWLPNSGGLTELLEEVSGMENVEFTTLMDYLKTHPPMKKLSFGQDTADGNFNGYNSWSEKATSPLYWTKVIRDRRLSLLLAKIENTLKSNEFPAALARDMEKSFDLRLRLQSTTNYGMSTPFVTGQREQTVESIISEMDELSTEMVDWAITTVRRDLDRRLPPEPPAPDMVYLDRLRIFSGNKGQADIAAGLLRFDLSGCRLKNSRDFFLVGEAGRSLELDLIKAGLDSQGFVNRAEFMIPPGSDAPEGTYYLYAGPGRRMLEKTAGENRSGFTLKNEYLEIELSPDGLISGVSHDGRLRLEAGSLTPSIRYRFNNGIIDCRPQKVSVSTSKNGPNPSLDISGLLSLPDRVSVKPGRFDYHLTLIKGTPLLLVQGEITYPQTRKWKTISGGHARLMKRYDPNWYETAPLELIWSPAATTDSPFKIIKRNYLGVESSYLLDYFRHSPENLDLADINNHITAEYAGVAAPGAGLAVAMDTSQLANFAFCPMKMNCKQKSELGIRLNPFGTYFGRQYRPPTWGNSHGYEAAVTAGGQYRSSAPLVQRSYPEVRGHDRLFRRGSNPGTDQGRSDRFRPPANGHYRRPDKNLGPF